MTPMDSIETTTHDKKISPNFSIIIQYDLRESNVTCTIDSFSNLFNSTTIETFAQRFHTLCRQLFSSSFDRQNQPIYQLSILLPHEQNMLQKLNNYTIKSNVKSCIHQAFIQQANLHPNKLALILDHQSVTYKQLLIQVQKLAFLLINDKKIRPGVIICQYIDRSIEMIVGILGIMMAGAIYAPLTPTDPLDRIQSLIHQVNSKLILVNQISRPNLTSLKVSILDISEVIESANCLNDIQIDQLSEVMVTPDSISHIVFTSGSTGTPKAVQIRHRNFMDYMQTHVIQTDDIVLQFTSCSFDSHLDEILVALVRGAQLAVLKPGGHFDFEYVTQTIYEKKVTYVGPAPSYLNALGKFLKENNHAQERVKSVRCWFLGGETLLSSTIIQFLPFVDEQTQFFNLYGTAEITVDATCHDVRREELFTTVSLPIGYPLVGYRIYLVDEYRQPVVPGQPGEIIIGGVGVFAGYYGRADLTAQALIEMENEECYATGDLGRLDVISGELIFIGRRDYQVKLRGQRIELGEIEETVMKEFKFITGCIVMKFTYDEQEHLVAYIEAPLGTIKEDDLRDQCRSLLPFHIIPSMFVILERFPLTVNCKIDRRALPSPNFTSLTETADDQIMPLTDMENRVQKLWSDVLHIERIPVNRSFFALRGSSIMFIKLYNLYQIQFGRVPDIMTCFRQATIIEHAKLLSETLVSAAKDRYEAWPCLMLDHDEASFAQSRIVLDEQIRMHLLTDKHIALYNIPLLYRLSKGSLSIKRLRQALQHITERHAILRTSLQFDSISGNLTQHIHSNNEREWFSFCTSFIDDQKDKSLVETIYNQEMTNQTYFDLAQAQVCRCHIVRHHASSVINDDDLLLTGDWIIFNFHHVACDGESEQIFLDELQQFYHYQPHLQTNEEQSALQYIDCELASLIYLRPLIKH